MVIAHPIISEMAVVWYKFTQVHDLFPSEVSCFCPHIVRFEFRSHNLSCQFYRNGREKGNNIEGYDFLVISNSLGEDEL